MKIIRSNLPPIQPSNGDGSRAKKANSPFVPPAAAMLPKHAAPPNPADQLHSASPVPKAGIGFLYNILLTFMGKSLGGDKHG